MRQHDGLHRGRRKRQRLPIQEPKRLESLKQSAIDEYPSPIGFQQIFRAGNGLGRAVESEPEHGGVVTRTPLAATCHGDAVNDIAPHEL